MGVLISRFRKKLTTLEQLKKIEEDLKKIDEYKRITERKQKRTVANLIIYGAALYILAVVIVFVWFLPENWAVRLGLMIPLVLVPAIIYWTKRLISKYFQNRMIRANEDYADLQRKKQDIIDNVMETETYNKAKEILSKYAPDKLEKKLQEKGAHMGADSHDLRKRTIGTYMTPPLGRMVPPTRPANPAPLMIANQPKNVEPPVLMPQSLFPKERSFSDKLVEYIVGDGPGYRYALICQHCHGHNGMALKEEFPYIAYKCCYCHQFNPARKERPHAPRLSDPSPPPPSPPKAPVPELKINEANKESNVNPRSLMMSEGGDDEQIENENKEEHDLNKITLNDEGEMKAEEEMNYGEAGSEDLNNTLTDIGDESDEVKSSMNKSEVLYEFENRESQEVCNK